jgi:acyl-CoA hydrolase
MEVGVRVDAENPKTGEVFHTASAYLTFVAIGGNGRPTPVPPLILRTEEEKRRHERAKMRREFRIKRREK